MTDRLEVYDLRRFRFTWTDEADGKAQAESHSMDVCAKDFWKAFAVFRAKVRTDLNSLRAHREFDDVTVRVGDDGEEPEVLTP